MLDLTIMEMAELLSACNLAIDKETAIVEDCLLEWRVKQSKETIKTIESAREKIYQAMKGK